MRRRALQVGLLGSAVVCVAFLVGCGGMEAVPSWDDMSDEQRRLHCEGIQTRLEVTDWSRSRSGGALRRYLALELERCSRGGYV